MTNKEYHAHPAFSSTHLKKIQCSTPFHYKYWVDNPQEQTPSLLFGSAAHKAVLEPETFSEEFAVAPNVDRRTKEGKEIYAAFVEESQGKDVISASDFETIEDMKDAIDNYPLARQLLTGECEKSFFWIDTDTGEECKVRPDCITEFEGKKYIVDYKTTDSCADGHFERTCRKYGYKLQAGMYVEGLFNTKYEDCGFAFVAQEKSAPYAVRVFICDPEFIKEGQEQFHQMLSILHECINTGNWYGYEGPFNQYEQLFGEEE